MSTAVGRLRAPIGSRLPHLFQIRRTFGAMASDALTTAGKAMFDDVPWDAQSGEMCQMGVSGNGRFTADILRYTAM